MDSHWLPAAHPPQLEGDLEREAGQLGLDPIRVPPKLHSLQGGGAILGLPMLRAFCWSLDVARQ